MLLCPVLPDKVSLKYNDETIFFSSDVKTREQCKLLYDKVSGIVII